jgi:hypothetical protein
MAFRPGHLRRLIVLFNLQNSFLSARDARSPVQPIAGATSRKRYPPAQRYPLEARFHPTSEKGQLDAICESM